MIVNPLQLSKAQLAGGLVSIDPSKRVAYQAIFEGGHLEEVVYQADVFSDREVATVVMESPRKYPGDLVRANDLIDLAAAGAKAAGWYRGQVYEVFPQQWKGQVPKKIHHARLRKSLSADEIKIVENCKKSKMNLSGLIPSKLHNVWDCVGLGLWALGRTRKGGGAP